MRRAWGAASVAAVALLVPLAAGAGSPAAAADDFVHLRPGQVADYRERVPVQVVFVGFERSQVDEAAFRAQLPASGSPKIRSRMFYGLPGELGLNYTYDYRMTYADKTYENALFTRLGSLARKQSAVDGEVRTAAQQAYNEMKRNVVDVGTNYYIDAPTVERHLVQNPAPGVDANRNTIYFINWWGRSDFKFHVYTKFGEPDPDTGYDFGVNRGSRKIVAWGGTSATDEETGFGRQSRTWFYDLSAGPDIWTGSYDVDNPDLDGDGEPDYRIPPAWEYLTRGGYRPLSRLASDLGLVTRYVGLDLLFTPSPLYPPVLTPDKLPDTVNLDLNYYQSIPGLDARDFLDPGYLKNESQKLLPFRLTTDEQTLRYDRKAYECVVGLVKDVSCYPKLKYPPFANLFLNNALKKDVWRDGGGDYEAGSFNYALRYDGNAPFLGFADDNYLDGTQSGVFNFFSPGIRDAGYGLTTTNIHEYGHHFGMSHPHDGYDPESGVDFGPSGKYWFVWAGDESNSMMSYIDLNWDFSQFDLDNADRFYAAGYTTVAQRVADKVLRSDRAGAAQAELRRADVLVGRAQAAITRHDYQAAVTAARAAYEAVRAGAADAGVRLVESDRGWFVKGAGENATATRADAARGANDGDDVLESRKRNLP